MYQHLVRNEEGEPLYVEDVMDAQEEHEFRCEEMQMRADDPYYAQMREKEEWYNKALSCFEEKGIEVPPSVVETLSRELRKKRDEIEEKKALDEVQPVLDYLCENLPHCKWYANFYPESFDEIAHVEIGCKNRPYVWELEEVIERSRNEGFFDKYGVGLEDYVGESDCTSLVSRYRTEGYWYAKYVRNWSGEEHCGQDMLFAIRKDWLEREDIADDEKYLVSMVAISPVKDCYGNSLYDNFKKKYPDDKYIVWFGEIRHNGEFNDTICFHWS